MGENQKSFSYKLLLGYILHFVQSDLSAEPSAEQHGLRVCECVRV